MEFEIIIKNSDNSHFPTEEKGFLLTYLILAILSLLFLGFYVKKFLDYNNKEDGIDWAYLSVMISLSLQTISFLFELIHLLVY